MVQVAQALLSYTEGIKTQTGRFRLGNLPLWVLLLYGKVCLQKTVDNFPAVHQEDCLHGEFVLLWITVS